ncbi:hypothetical protein [Aquipuribacter hungaricus]|uniref:Uncharacterized protein n=1 Tax=Aquipuribacter hungaricus TaxID=545624 RepID=A0ABV7WIB1_9MICO
MQIPRQADRSRAPRAERLDGAAELRARRRHLVEQLRGVGYWQRLVQARTDLQVAGLLYACPVPAAVRPAPPSPAAAAWSPSTLGDDDGLTALVPPPAGLDVLGLVGGVPTDPGAQLGRLRDVALVLVRRSRALQQELDSVTAALHACLARDGAVDDHASDAAEAPAAGTGPVPAPGHAALA